MNFLQYVVRQLTQSTCFLKIIFRIDKIIANQRKDNVTTGALLYVLGAHISFSMIMKTSRFIAAGVRNNGNEVNGPASIV